MSPSARRSPPWPRSTLVLALLAGAARAGDPPYYEIEILDQLPVYANGAGHGEGLHGDVVVGWQGAYGDEVGLPFVSAGGVVTQLAGGPGAGLGVNAAGEIVGFTLAGLGAPHVPVRWVAGVPGPLAGLGGEGEARAVSASGVVVGWTLQPGGRRAFTWQAGAATILPTLGGAEAEAFAVNGLGHVAGWALTAGGRRHAVLWKDGAITDLGPLGGAESEALDVTDGGVVVGALTLADGEKRAFRWEAGVVQDLGLLPGKSYAEAWSANEDGLVVGRSYTHPFFGLAGGTAFVWRDGVLYDLTLQAVAGDPVEDIVSATEVDAEGRITGVAYTPLAEFRAYRATPIDPPDFEYDAIVIPPPAGASHVLPEALNDLGHAVGFAVFPTPPVHRAFLWTPEDGTVVLPPPPGYDNNYVAKDVNAAGIVAGDSGTGGTDLAWRYEDGAYSFIPILPGYGPAAFSTAEGIAPNGDVASTSGDFSGPPPGESAVLATYAGALLELETGSAAVDVNALGQVLIDRGGSVVRWTPHVGPEVLVTSASGLGLNDLGQVTGGFSSKAYLYTDGVGAVPIVDISTCVSDDFEYGVAVNDHGVVVGVACLPGIANGWVWSAEKGVRLLDDVIDPSLPYFLDEPVDVNDAGQILVLGSDQLVGGSRTFLLTPTKHCQESLGFGGPGAMDLRLCGAPLASGASAVLEVSGGPPDAPLVVLASTSFLPTPAFGGLVVPVPPELSSVHVTDGAGALVVSGVPGGGGPLTLYAQALALDLGRPGLVAISNALEVELLP